MEKFIKVISTAVPLPIEEVDTDQIIPAIKNVSKFVIPNIVFGFL